MKDKGIFDYEICCVNDTEYELNLTFYTNNSLMMFIFNKATKTPILKEKLPADIDFNKVEAFEVPAKYYNLLKTAISKPLKIVRRIFKKDGVSLHTERVVYARYIKYKELDKWHIEIRVHGLYMDSR